MKPIIAPSILSADFGYLAKDIEMVNRSEAEWVHIDIMDGQFVPNFGMGLQDVEYICKASTIPVDAHLMIENPDKYVADFVDAGADIICVHVESTKHLNRTIQLIKSYKKKVGVALNPSTSLDTIKYDLDNIDMVLIMTVNPGFGGQKFIPQMLQKIKELRKIAPNIDIQVDGGINDEISKLVIEAGANVLVAGSYVFNGNYKDKIDSLRP